MAKMDLILLHAPSVYDFRKEFLFYGPVSDLVPSTPVFEMYPFGFMTMATALHSEGYRVRIINLASMMLNDPKLDVEKFISRLDADVFGIDLHWLPHAHGSLEIARIVRDKHPGSKILFGGYSSTYYHQELINYDQVDMVLRGDSTEVPVCELFHALEKGNDLSKVQNLTWKEGGKVRSNPITYVPKDLDHLDVDYGWIVRSVIRHRDLEGAKPFKDWDRYPLTVAFTVRGCTVQCAVCGGSCGAMKGFLGRSRPAFRSPEKVAEDIYNIQNYLRAPTFVVGDLRQGGKHYADRFFSRAKELGIDNQVILELFTPAPLEFFKQAKENLSSYSIEFSPDSHDETVRRALGRNFDTASMEKTVYNALDQDARRFDIFFMIGLPQQTRISALDSARYAKRLYDVVSNDTRLFVYTSPLAPFLDPGSIAFENADKLGYISLARTLEEHRRRLLSPSWKYVLSYETRWMIRDDIAEVSYDAADILNEVRHECGLIDARELEDRKCRTAAAREMMRRIDEVVAIEDERMKKEALMSLKKSSEELMNSTICQKGDLEWNAGSVIKSAPRAVLGMIRGRKRR
ncbi:MAG: TIGR04190 family B12-binding domain/radical SAM domain protein [Methanomassiliicoccales archaeon]|nr:MAG: TIGR04190 family B12-binding domain/radical SAM domain protein [Methanomassiliicoccales archaeon]